MEPEDHLSFKIRNALVAAGADVRAAELDNEIQRAAALAVVLLVRLGYLGVPITPPGVSSKSDELPESGSPENGSLDRIAARLNLSREVVELVYDGSGDELTLVVPSRRLAEDRANATRQLAQLVVGGRQAAGVEEWTPIAVVRKVVADYGRLDSGNFAAVISRMDDVFLFKGRGGARELKVTRRGFELVAQQVQTAAGPAS